MLKLTVRAKVVFWIFFSTIGKRFFYDPDELLELYFDNFLISQGGKNSTYTEH